MDEAEAIRRDFAAGWASVGEAWGIAPSTAAVQGYLLLHGGPLTETELREALGLSHRAAFGALAECERWGLVEAVEPRRTGARGPAGRAWIAVGDHWAWFRNVAASRKARETDPVAPVLDDCLRRSEAAGDDGLRERVANLVAFTRQVDRGVGAVVRSDVPTIAHLFAVLSALDDEALERLLAALATVPAAELSVAAQRIGTMRPELLRRLVAVVARPGVGRLLARLA